MRFRSLVFLVVCVVIGGAGWNAFRARRATAELEAQYVVARQTRDGLAVELQRALAPMAPAPAKPDSVARVAAPADAPPVKAAAARPQPPGFMDLARDNPAMMNQWIANQRAQLQRQYGVWFEKLQFTPAQREKFKNLLAAQAARQTDIGTAAKVHGLDFNDPVVLKLAADSRQQLEREFVAELGEPAFRSYQDFERTIPVRGFVDGFAVQMAATEPLTPAQAEQLSNALIGATPVSAETGSLSPGKVDWPAVDRLAAQFLSPTQLAAWKLGVAHNPAGGSRLDHELRNTYDAALAKTPKTPGG